MSPQRPRTLLSTALVGALTAAVALVAPVAASAGPEHHAGRGAAQLPKVPQMTGYGGAVSSVDRDASQAGIDVLRRGGNAADAAIAVAAMLGVVEPYTSGIGGGGFFVWHDGRSGKVSTIDGREAAPATFTEESFIDPATGAPLPFATAVNSGLSVGVPGTPALWQRALDLHGTMRLGRLLEPAERKAVDGIVVDQSFHDLTAENEARFARFPETSRVFLRGGKAPAVGSRWNNPDIAKAYREIRLHGVESIYRGTLGRAIVDEARNPSTAPGDTVLKGQITLRDLAAYRALDRRPTHASYRGLDVYGMGVPSSGGIAVGEILNLLEAYDRQTGRDLSQVSNAEYLHRFSEASATAFADRNRWVGDVSDVPTRELLSQGFADERACLFSEATAMTRPVPFGSPDGSYASCAPGAGRTPAAPDGRSTTSLSVTDRWGNVVSFTTTIEQYGGSGLTVPGYGFLLNNELTDFNFAPLKEGVPDPNLPGPGKRPRSSMSPTIILADGKPFLSVGSPGGATIITTVAQIITEYLDRDLSLVDAIAAPRLSSRNGTENAEQALLDSPEAAALRAQGHVLALQDPIGNAVAIRLLGHGKAEAAAETTRRGGGSAMVVRPSR